MINMKALYLRWLFDVDEKYIRVRSSIWNLFSSLINGFVTAILLFVITRSINIEIAGMFSIAAAIANQCVSLGAFGVRNVHAADVKQNFSFMDYYTLRILTSIIMFIVLLFLAFYQGYTIEKAMIVLTFGIFKSADVIEDIYHGEFQRLERLDIAVILQTIRYVISLITLIFSIFLTKNLIFSNILATVVTYLIMFCQNIQIQRIMIKKVGQFDKKKTMNLFTTCLPIALSNIINMYIINAPKYSIDSLLTNTMQTFYGVLSMPVFTINLISTVIYRPMITKLSTYWINKEYDQFKKNVVKQICITIGLTLVIASFGYMIGLKLLGIIYNVSIMKYRLAFMILLFGGGMNTIAVFFSVLLTIQMKQKTIIIAYIIDLIFCLLFSDKIVSILKLNGAACVYFLSNFILAAVLIFIYVISFRREKKLTL